LAVAAALETPRGEALAAVLDLLASSESDDRIVTGQLARIVHLSSSTGDRSSASFWGPSGASPDAAIEPLVLASHAVLEECKIDDARRLVFDVAKTLVVLLADTVGLDGILEAGKRSGLTKSVMFEFAAKIADDSTTAKKPRTTTSLKERLHDIKRVGSTVPTTIRGGGDATTADESSSSTSAVGGGGGGGDATDAAARIAELRQRLSAAGTSSS